MRIKIKTKKYKGFTLMEVLVAVAITGLVVAGGFRLIAMSMRTLAEI
ncbi:MAG: prepilin-type N-terminal cleavage/methylation domain-containing protein, partial [Synergistaceae bacterium]|nr:prepilin-type N-terminal cleavage/methylation domain-containing protein [Synergistaceae bacterium]